MPKFIVEFYELHAQMYEVEAESKEDAINGALNGEGTALDNASEYIGVADRYYGYAGTKQLPDGIRSVEFESN
jgi:hypothetical protein